MQTFVVRVYRSAQDEPPDDDRLRGVVEEIATRSQATFHSSAELMSILRQGATRDEAASPPGSPTTEGSS